MKKITTINFNALRNDEFKGVHGEGVKFAKAITEKDMQSIIAIYEKAFMDFTSFLDVSLFESKAKQAQLLDIERENMYAACRKVAKATRDYPDESVRGIGMLIWKVFDENPSPINNNQQQSTGILARIVKCLHDIGDENLEACGFKIWLDKLESVNSLYVEADMARNTERGQRELEHCRKLRAVVVEAYRMVSMVASVKAATGSESCKLFVESMDGTVIFKKLQVNMRKERAKQGADPATVSPSAVTPATVDPGNSSMKDAA